MKHIRVIEKWVADLFWTFNPHYRPWNKTEIGIFIAVILLLTVWMFSLLKKGKIVWSQFIAVFCISIYMGFLASSMIFLRPATAEPRYKLALFWSWKRALDGDMPLLREIIMNVVIMIPIGFVMPIIFPHSRHIILVSLVLGILLSSTIEVIQLVGHLGLFEWDDILGNSMGCLIGCTIMCEFRDRLAKTSS